MRALDIASPGQRLSVLCLGAHSDDIEIGAGATILGWIAAGIELDIHWCVLSAAGLRAAEAETSAKAFTAGASSVRIELHTFRDGFFPYDGGELKFWMEGLKSRVRADLVLTHRGDDAHQDHREVCRLTWNTFRDHLILEYEIPKWDGDLGQPNVYIPADPAILERKAELLLAHFGSQRSKDWFTPDTFRGLARLRGMECRAPGGYAEGFYLRKATLGWRQDSVSGPPGLTS
jgi:LmbE family N-acetylglucosaminyl deacetylase